MQIKLLKQVLVGDADVIATPKGTVVDLPEALAKEFITLGHAEAHEIKKSPEPLNKKAPDPKNK